MAQGHSVNIDQLRSTAEAVGGNTDQVDQLKKASGRVNVPPVSWGGLGLMTLFSSYKEMLDDLNDHLQQMSDGFASMRESLTGAADRYQQDEDDNAGTLDGVAALDPISGTSNEPNNGPTGRV